VKAVRATAAQAEAINESGRQDPPTSLERTAQRQRPWPAVNEDNAFFWEGIKAGELRVQRCKSCNVMTHPPRPHCASCGSFELGYYVASGRGQVYSHVTFHRPLVAPFSEPYSVAVIELDVGTRLVSQVVGIPPDDVHIDLAVQVDFVEVEDGLTLPLFRPLDADK
jgi:uncharacterized protein